MEYLSVSPVITTDPITGSSSLSPCFTVVPVLVADIVILPFDISYISSASLPVTAISYAILSIVTLIFSSLLSVDFIDIS